VDVYPGPERTQADVVVAGFGQPEGLIGSMVKPGAAVLDLGFHRVAGQTVGAVHRDSVGQVAGALTPVPGGVGPMTVAVLLANTLEAALRTVR
jgi:methylenetetrahydrofolate dehydrogenase (NADP+)/methenyltetrahydrofolate cyclohydrolase